MIDEKVVGQMANLADLPPDGGPLRNTLVLIYLALRAGDISWEVVVEEMQDIRRDAENYEWTPMVKVRY